MQKDYLKSLELLKNRMNEAKNTKYIAFAKVLSLIVLNARYENIAFDRDLKTHPYILVNELILDTLKMFEIFCEVSFLDAKELVKNFKSKLQEEKHKKLFNNIWNNYNEEEFQKYIDRYIFRIEHNNLEEFIRDKDCVDFGCGNGVFCFALIQKGAKSATGIDFGEKSIEFANEYSKLKKIDSKTKFKVSTVYETGFEDNSFDFAIQNGVFHHLDDENKAIKEVKRVLKEGGWFWYYTSGEGKISNQIFDVSVEILKDISDDFVKELFNLMGANVNKKIHFMDALNATYRHTTYQEITKRLSSFGFDNFKRLSGGFETDCDLDVIKKDKYGKEKFGEGDLRILCQLIKK